MTPGAPMHWGRATNSAKPESHRTSAARPRVTLRLNAAAAGLRARHLLQLSSRSSYREGFLQDFGLLQ